MAALRDTSLPELVELPHLTGNDLNPLLNEEITTWNKRFAWDFKASADLLRKYLQIHSLFGYGLRVGRDIVGYAYYVCESKKGLIGDFFVRSEFANTINENMLLAAVVQAMMATPGIHRIESQLMMLQSPVAQPAPFQRFLKRYDRYFMEIARERVWGITPKPHDSRTTFVPWSERWHEEVAHLVAGSYRGHVDAEINDQYRSIPGARHFLLNIVKFPGCGKFSADASVVAVDERTGRVCGVCLTSFVSANAGHVTQLCTLPAVRGAHIGHELLRRSLTRLVELGATSASLTVTCSNIDAVKLYESIGFQAEAKFPALVWEGF